MASNYPTSLDNFTNPTSNDSLNSPSHSLQHADINDAVEALQRKVGIGSSTAGSATSGQVLTAGTGGTTTWTTPTESGLTLVKTQTITTQSTVNITNSFSTTYDNYKIIFNATAASADLNIRIRLLVGTTPESSSNYYWQYTGLTNSGAGANNTGVAQTSIPINYIATAAPDESHASLDLYFPFLAKNTALSLVSSNAATAALYHLTGSGLLFTSTSYDGIQITTNTGTVSGIISIYGYKK